ncbi:MAG: glutathione regulate potassium efflux protein KefB [Rickettsiaceae bacterium]|jgi:CPA2 family monovalent cation:H+ antiporter-2|nr:glutathione regulate potassium efflux protein KefB [Rickettsiaceae bacterium]
MQHDISYLQDILILLFASVAIVIVFKQLRLSPALGYLVVGATIGPSGFGILAVNETTNSIAEFGVVFLLFAIGLELTLDKLISMKKYVLGFGSLQVILTSILLSIVCYKLGLSKELSILVGTVLSLSSTAIVMQVIDENAEQSTRVGRLSFSVLLLQDLAVIPILVLLPLLSNPNLNVAHALGGAIVKAVMAMAIILFIGRFLLKPIFRIVVSSKSDVLFLSVTLIVVLGSAFVTYKMGLSFAFGAFVAGLMVAETEYKYRVENEILSLESLLMGLFFITIGMSFNVKMMIAELPLITILAIGLITCKALIIIVLCRLFKFPLAPAVHSGLLLSQGSEFAFIVFIMAVNNKIMGEELSQLLMTVVTLSMAVTPLLATLGRKIKGQLYIRDVLRDNKIKREIGDISKHIVVIGFGRVGRIVGYLLRKREANYIVLDSNHRVVRIEKANGYNIYYGDAMNLDILKYVGIEKAEAVIVAMEDEFDCIKITRFIHTNFPQVSVITKAETVTNAERFKRVGASLVVSKNLETGLQLGKAALSAAGVKGKEVDSVLESFRDTNSEFVKNVIFQYNDQYQKVD